MKKEKSGHVFGTLEEAKRLVEAARARGEKIDLITDKGASSYESAAYFYGICLELSEIFPAGSFTLTFDAGNSPGYELCARHVGLPAVCRTAPTEEIRPPESSYNRRL